MLRGCELIVQLGDLRESLPRLVNLEQFRDTRLFHRAFDQPTGFVVTANGGFACGFSFGFHGYRVD